MRLKYIVLLTRLDQLLTEDLPQAIVHMFGGTLSHGKVRNSLLWPEGVQKQNIEPWFKVFVKVYG